MNRFTEIERVGSPVDADFEEIEAGSYAPLEKAKLIRDLWEEMTKMESSFSRRGGLADLHKTADGVRTRHFLLPGVYGATTLSEENEGYPAEFQGTEVRNFIKVGQGELWLSCDPRASYFKTATSECSTIIGWSDGAVGVSHLSYSLAEQAIATMQAFKDAAIQQLYAVISTGDTQEKRAASGRERRLRKEDYMELGVSGQNIIEFEYPVQTERGITKGIQHVIVAPGSIFAYKADYKREGSMDVRIGDHYDEKLLRLGIEDRT